MTNKDEDFGEWYNETVDKANLCDKRYPIKGMNVWTPYGWKIMTTIDSFIRRDMEATGHGEVCFPLMIPETEFKKEKEHIKGFDEEVYWVTHAGLNPLDVRLVARPTSETAMYPMFSLWVRSHQDLPLKIFQIVNTLRENGFCYVRSMEILRRGIEVGPGGVRPSFKMLGHTGYLTFARKRKIRADAPRTTGTKPWPQAKPLGRPGMLAAARKRFPPPASHASVSRIRRADSGQSTHPQRESPHASHPRPRGFADIACRESVPNPRASKHIPWQSHRPAAEWGSRPWAAGAPTPPNLPGPLVARPWPPVVDNPAARRGRWRVPRGEPPLPRLLRTYPRRSTGGPCSSRLEGKPPFSTNGNGCGIITGFTTIIIV